MTTQEHDSEVYARGARRRVPDREQAIAAAAERVQSLDARAERGAWSAALAELYFDLALSARSIEALTGVAARTVLYWVSKDGRYPAVAAERALPPQRNRRQQQTETPANAEN